MKHVLFAIYLVWITAMTLIFAPVTIALGIATGALILIAAAWGAVFNVLTFGTFK
jgi:hypothetical protein